MRRCCKPMQRAATTGRDAAGSRRADDGTDQGRPGPDRQRGAKTLSYTIITSPIDGRTGIRNVDVGNLVRSRQRERNRDADAESGRFRFCSTFPQQQLPQINWHAQARGSVQIDALRARATRAGVDRGTLQVVDNQIDQTTGTVRLKAEFPNEKLALWPGALHQHPRPRRYAKTGDRHSRRRRAARAKGPVRLRTPAGRYGRYARPRDSDPPGRHAGGRPLRPHGPASAS